MTQPILSSLLIFCACACAGPNVLPMADGESAENGEPSDIDPSTLEAAWTAFGEAEDLDAAILSFATSCGVTDVSGWADKAHDFATSEDGSWPGTVESVATCEGGTFEYRVRTGAYNRLIHPAGRPPAVEQFMEKCSAVAINGNEDADGNGDSPGRPIRSLLATPTAWRSFVPVDDGSEPVETSV